jgi:hypothetical protein
MATKHRKQGQRARKIALVGAASATATCLTVGAAPPPAPHHAVTTVPVALAATTGPNYTELIESLSNSTNNILFASSNFQNALTSLTNPIAAASGGLLPTFSSGVTQENLATLQGLLGVLSQLLANPNLNNIPGLPAGSLTTILTALAPGLAPVTGTVVPVVNNLTGTLAGTLGALQGVVNLLNNVNGAIAGLNTTFPGLNLSSITGIVDLNNLLNSLLGITGSTTQYTSGISWPFLGVAGSTTVDNTIVQLPSLTVAQLVNNALGAVHVPDVSLNILPGLGGLTSLLGLPATLPLGSTLDSALQGPVGDLLNPLLNPLNGIATPSVTAWLPAASGNYTLPLGGSIGYLATMPTIAIGPLNSLTGGLLPPLIPPSLIDLNSETVLAIPLFAGGVTLPLGVASLATVGTPGIVFPTATGVTTIGGASVTAVNLFGLPVFTNTNLQLANYYGTNGIDWSNGTNIATVLGVPVVYSLGSFYVGDKGFGFTGPSLFGVGLIPPLKVGTAPNQESSDGLVGSIVLNGLLGTARLVPTQTTSVTQLLGLPDVGATLSSSVLTPGYTAFVTPLALQLTNFLNENAGSIVNGGASGFEQLTAAIANLSYGLPGATTPTVPLAGESADALTMQSTPQLVVKTTTPSTVVEKKTVITADAKASTDPITNVQNQVRDANTQIKSSIAAANAKTKAAVTKATADIEKSVKNTSDTLNKIAKDGENQVRKTVAGVQSAVKKTADSVGNAAKAATEKKSETKKAASK